jgi:Fe-S-cluster-containing dehydrogenase component
MSKWTLVFDAGRCNGCNSCALAVQDEYVGNRFPGYAEEAPRHGHRWIEVRRHERGQPPMVDVSYLTVMCQHCEDPPCARAAHGGAVEKRPDGIVLIHPERSHGQKAIVDACPYGAVWWNEEKQVPQHWNFDAHLIDQGWPAPRCVQACPTGALTAMRLDDAQYETLRREGAGDLRPELASRPRVLYRNIAHFTHAFVGGTLVRRGAEGEECVQGIPVKLFHGDDMIGAANTDSFGDFKIDGIALQPEPLQLALRILVDPPMQRDIIVTESHYLGKIEVRL